MSQILAEELHVHVHVNFHVNHMKYILFPFYGFSSVQCHLQLFVTPWTAARQAYLSCTISQSLLKLMSIESVMPSNHLVLCHPLLLLPSIFPSIRVFFPMSQLFASGGQSTRASAALLPVNLQGWFPLGWTGWLSLQSKGLSRVFPNTTILKRQFFGAQENKVCHGFHFFCIYLPWSVGAGCCDLSFLNVEFKASFFTVLFHTHQEAL